MSYTANLNYLKTAFILMKLSRNICGLEVQLKIDSYLNLFNYSSV